MPTYEVIVMEPPNPKGRVAEAERRSSGGSSRSKMLLNMPQHETVQQLKTQQLKTRQLKTEQLKIAIETIKQQLI